MRADLHLARRVEHVLGGSTIALGYALFLERKVVLVVVGALLALYSTIELLRFSIPAMNEWFLRTFRAVVREREERGLHSGVYYMASCLLAVALFPKAIAVLSILFLALGDPAAALVGTLAAGRSPALLRGKTLAGTLAATAACSFAALAFLGADQPLLVLAGGLAGGLAELLPIPPDDNFTIPLLSGAALWGAFRVLSPAGP